MVLPHYKAILHVYRRKDQREGQKKLLCGLHGLSPFTFLVSASRQDSNEVCVR